MKSSDKYYLNDEKRVIRYHHKLLLADLLYLNYAFSNNKYDGITGEDVLKYVIKGTRYTALERLVYEYIGRNFISYISIKSLEKDIKNKYENNTKKKNK